LGNGSRWEEIAALNKETLPNPNRLSPGMRLVLPPPRPPREEPAGNGPREPVPVPVFAARALPPITETRYVVKEGDSLAGIALARYNDARLAGGIIRANEQALAAGGGRLVPGMTLQLPPLPAAPPPAPAPGPVPPPRR